MSKYIEKIWTGEISPVEFAKQPDREYKEAEIKLFGKIEKFEKLLDAKQKAEFQVLIKTLNNFINISEKQAFCQGYSLGACIMSESFINAENIGKIK